jgi:hypothetical protein
VRLNVCNPFGSPGHPTQAAFLSIDRSQPGTTRSHYVGGRGSAKTTSGILLALKSAIEWNPGLPGLWTEPTYGLCQRVFLREWAKIVPKELWTYKKSESKIILKNGSEIDVVSRNVDNPGREISKGPNYAWAIDDEAANKFDADKYWDIDAAVRHPSARHRFHDTLSTPQMGEYYTLCHSHFHNQINATSFDNPFLDRDFASSLASSLDPQRARQEIYGEWIALSGRIWDVADATRQWPHGNLHPHTWQPSRPYILGCDLGVQSAWLIIQQVTEPGMREPIDVIVAEYLPNDGDTQSVLRQIHADYGMPSRVFVGADVNTRSLVDGGTAAYAMRRQWGGLPVIPITGTIANKDLQYQISKGRLLNAQGQRRCCVSSGLRTYPERSPRGIRALWQADQWPSGRQIRVGELLPKDKRTAGKAALEDVRDAWLYAMIGMHPPQFIKEQ